MIKEPDGPAQACVIWMHGLGADGNNMYTVAQELPLSLPVRHVCLNAPVRPVTFNQGMQMRAWYDITGFQASDREDKSGILESVALIEGVIEQQIAAGFSRKQIFLAGFSQGGAMALVAGLLSPEPIGGIISLSAYLPLAEIIDPKISQATPIFIAAGIYDQVVLPAWTLKSVQWLRTKGFNQVSVHHYPMEHTICFEELQEIANWFTLGEMV